MTDPYKRKWYEKEYKLMKEGKLLNDFEKSFINKSRDLRNQWDEKYQQEIVKSWKSKKIGTTVQEQQQNSDLAKIFMVLN